MSPEVVCRKNNPSYALGSPFYAIDLLENVSAACPTSPQVVFSPILASGGDFEEKGMSSKA
jgi:hypothetical protein